MTAPTLDPEVAPPPGPPRRRRWLLPLLGTAVAVAAVLGVLQLLPDGADSPTIRPTPSTSEAATPTTVDPGPEFEVRDGEILADGEPFTPIGVNLLGPDAFFNPDGVTAGMAATVADRWGLNAVRLNACLPIGCDYGVHNERNDDLDALVEELTSKGLVVMIALHQVEPGRWPTVERTDQIDAWWRDLATRFGDNELVWFNLLNEPGSETPVPELWFNLHKRWLEVIRQAGARNVVVVDGTQWGQEAGVDGDDVVGPDTSAILRWGEQLAALDDKVVFSVHVYDQWGDWGRSDQARADRLARFVEDVRAKGLAILIGETGGVDDQSDPSSIATRAAYAVADRLDVGLFAWHGQAIDDHHLVNADGRTSSIAALLDGGANLTWQGRLLWDLVHG